MTETNYTHPDDFEWPDDAAFQIPGGLDGTYDTLHNGINKIPRGAGTFGRVVIGTIAETNPTVITPIQ